MVIISKNTTGTYANTGQTGVNDTRMNGLAPTTNYSSGSILTSSCWDSSVDDVGNSVIKFDLTAFAGGSAANAVIGFYLNGGNNDFRNVSMYPLLVSFIDTQATFQIRSTGNAWNTNNARGSGTDRDASAVATASRSATSGAWMTFSGSGLTALINDYLDGTRTNNGLMIELTDYADDLFTYQDYVSSEGTDGLRPYLSFDYTPGGVTVDLTAATLSTSAKTVQNRLAVTTTAATLSTSAKTIQNRLTATLTAAALAWSAKTVQNKLTATLTAAAMSWSAKAIEFVQTGVPVIFDLTVATLSMAANTVQNKLTATLTAAQQSWSAKTVQNRLTVALSAAQITLTGLAISARLALTLAAATMASWSAKAVQNRLTVALTRATLNLQPLAMDFVSDAIVEVARRFRSRLSKYRKLLKQRRY